jgi:hypothetical protein
MALADQAVDARVRKRNIGRFEETASGYFGKIGVAWCQGNMPAIETGLGPYRLSYSDSGAVDN